MNRIFKPVYLVAVLAMILSLVIALVPSVVAASSKSSINVASYDFNKLKGSDNYTDGWIGGEAHHYLWEQTLDGQDNWTSIGYKGLNTRSTWWVAITKTLGFDGTEALRFELIGSGVGADASRLNDAKFSIPDFDGAVMGFFQADFGVGYWGNEFALAYDANDGVIRKTDPSEIGPRLLVGSEGNRQIKVISADGSTTTTALSNANGASGGDWLRLRLVIDFTANSGQGSGSVFYQNLTEGDTVLQPLDGLQNVNLKLNPSATDARNSALWNAMWLHMEGATNQLDNIVIGGGGSEDYLTGGYLTGGGQITTGNGKNGCKISFGGNVRYTEDSGFVGQWETNFHNVSGDSLDDARFHSTSITLLEFYHDSVPTLPADANVVHFKAEGMLNGEDGYTLNVWLADRGEPGKMIDAIWMQLLYGATTELYRTLPDFPEDAPGATLLTHGNLQIHS